MTRYDTIWRVQWCHRVIANRMFYSPILPLHLCKGLIQRISALNDGEKLCMPTLWNHSWFIHQTVLRNRKLYLHFLSFLLTSSGYYRPCRYTSSCLPRRNISTTLWLGNDMKYKYILNVLSEELSTAKLNTERDSNWPTYHTTCVWKCARSGVGLLGESPPLRFPNCQNYKIVFLFDYYVHIWQVYNHRLVVTSSKIRTRFKVFKSQFCKIKVTHNEEFNEQSFNKPYPWPIATIWVFHHPQKYLVHISISLEICLYPERGQVVWHPCFGGNIGCLIYYSIWFVSPHLAFDIHCLTCV